MADIVHRNKTIFQKEDSFLFKAQKANQLPPSNSFLSTLQEQNVLRESTNF